MSNLIELRRSQDRRGRLHSTYLLARLAAIALYLLVRSILLAQISRLFVLAGCTGSFLNVGTALGHNWRHQR